MGVENARATDPSTKPYICDSDIGWDELLDEGYDPDHSPLGPVYCRIIRRGNQKFYCSTCWVALHQILSGWGMKGLTHCDPKTKMAIAMIETLLD